MLTTLLCMEEPKVKALVGSSETWKRVFYLFVEFPFGIIGVTLVTVTAAFFALIATPFFYAQIRSAPQPPPR